MGVLFLFLLAAGAYGQTPTFDAASVKPHDLNDRIVTIDVGPGPDSRPEAIR
jgi:hypothetical protein